MINDVLPGNDKSYEDDGKEEELRKEKKRKQLAPFL